MLTGCQGALEGPLGVVTGSALGFQGGGQRLVLGFRAPNGRDGFILSQAGVAKPCREIADRGVRFRQ